MSEGSEDARRQAHLLESIRALTQEVAVHFHSEALPQLVFPLVVNACQADIAAYYVPENSQQLKLIASHPDSFWSQPSIRRRFRRRDLTSYAIGRAIRARAPVFMRGVEDAPNRDEYEAFSPDIGSEFVIPIFAKGSLAAVFVMSRFKANPFSDGEHTVADAAAVLLSIAYETAIERRTRENAVAFLKRTATLQPDDPDRIFKEFLQAVEHLIRARFVSLWLFNELDDTLVIRAFFPNAIDKRRITFARLTRKVLNVGDCLSGDAVRDHQPRVFFGIERDPRYANKDFARRHRLTWFISLPIVTPNGGCYGVVNLYPEHDERVPDTETLEVMRLLVTQIGSAISLASMRRTGEIQKVIDRVFFQLLDSVDRQKPWDDLSHAVAAELRCEATSIFVRRGDATIGLIGTTGLNGAPPYRDVVYQSREGLTGTAFATGDALIHYREHDATRNIHISKFREVLRSSTVSRSILLVPFRDRAGKVLGVIRCNNKEDTPNLHCGRFTRDDVTVLERIGSMVGDVIEKTEWLKRKRNELDQYIHKIHHELLSPIDGIITQSDWLKREVISEGKFELVDRDLAMRRTTDILEAARQIEMLVKSIGADDDDIRLSNEQVDVLHLLYTCRGWLRTEARRACVDIDIGQVGGALIRGDKRQLMRVIYNVLQNAVKYADTAESARTVSVRRSTEDRRLVLQISDNGIGVEADDVGRVFERHERGANARRLSPVGAGLGLSFARRILRAHGGEILLTSIAKPTIFELDFGVPIT